MLDAASLAAAREHLADEDVDLILLDMNLPDGNGLTLARELASGGVPAAAARPAVVAVTASVLPAGPGRGDGGRLRRLPGQAVRGGRPGRAWSPST